MPLPHQRGEEGEPGCGEEEEGQEAAGVGVAAAAQCLPAWGVEVEEGRRPRLPLVEGAELAGQSRRRRPG